MAGARPGAAAGLVRARLIACLDRPAGLTLVVAPAGSGKTTLLAQYAAAAAEPVAWHRLAPEDTDPQRLAARLRAAVAAGAGTLVLDDFDVAVGTAAERAVEDLLTSGTLPPRVFVASRRLPSFNVSRAEVGDVAIVTADDLRFRSWEVERLFGDVYAEPLPPADAAVLTRRTEGWAAGLHLFHLSTAGRPLGDRRRAIGSLSGRSRFARAYLARTVLDDLPEELREFLRLTCVFGVLTAARCDRLLGSADAQRRLEELERRQALTTSDDDGRTFRYHEVLRRHLETALLEDLGEAGARDWYATAAGLLEDDGAVAEAVVAYARAERWPDVTRLLRGAGDPVVGAGEAERIPARLVEESPWLSLAVARRAVADGRLAEARERYRHAESLAADPRVRRVAAAERRLADVWLGAPERPDLHWLDRVRAALRRSPLDAAEPRGERPEDVLASAVALLLAGQAGDAAALLRDRCPVPDGEFAALAVRLVTAVCAALDGAAAAPAVERIGADAERTGVPWVARACAALAACRDAGAPAPEAADDPWGALLVAFATALAGLLRGEGDAAAFAAVAGRATALEAGTVAAWAAAFGALAAGDPAAARRAEAAARAAGVPGARAVALLARGDDAEVGGERWPALLRARLGAPACAVPSPAADVREDRPLALRCLGGFSLDVVGRDLDWRLLRPRAATALRLLAMHAGLPVHRETLLAALWPDVPVAPATHNLQVAVSSLRSFLEPGQTRGSTLLVRQGDAYALVLPEGAVADVVTFRDGLRDAQRARAEGDADALRAALRAAVAAYGGDLLPGDGPAEWVAAERDRLRTLAASAAAELAEVELAAARCDEAAAAAARSIEIDRFLDGSWRLLVDACTRAGDAAAAERARRRYADVLHDLGVRP
ncbi:MAG TPA: BTAD domain-containing putative transcriptional regulator [Mycobacteriales bacterium]|jgi:DNA-binding SARP family transcriptional activator|nr:BTAD domain-containing putative transcriptional regulator [Mycobacteriales bacterium]